MRYSGEDNLNGMEGAPRYNASILAEVLKRFRTEDVRILDFGAGNGWLARQVEEATGRQVCCLEPAENMRAYLPPDSPRELEQIDSGTVDFLYSSNVLEHIEDDVGTMSEIWRVLKPSGHVFLYLPAFQRLYSSMDKKVGHFRRYDMSMLKRLLGKGWRVLDMRYADSLGFWATLAFKLIEDRSGAFPDGQVRFYDRWIFPVSRFLDKVTRGRLWGKNVMVWAEKTAWNA